MKFLKYTAFGLIALILALALIGLALPSRFESRRELTIKAPPEKLYALIAAPKAWKQWSPWNERDPNMRIVYSGPESGLGAKWAWESKSEGDGAMEFTRAVSPRELDYTITFKDWDGPSYGVFKLTPQGDSTTVSWMMKGDMGANPFMRWMALMFDRMIGPQFEQGLSKLKQIAEKA